MLKYFLSMVKNLSDCIRHNANKNGCKFSEVKKNHLKEKEYHRDTAVELNKIGVDLYNIGDLTSSIDFFREASNSLSLISNEYECPQQKFTNEYKKRLALKIMETKERIQQTIGSYDVFANVSDFECFSGALCFTKALQLHLSTKSLNEDYAIVFYNMGLIHLHLSSIGLAQRMFELALSLICETDLSDAQSLRTFRMLSNNLGWTYQHQFNFDEASNIFERSFMHPNKNFIFVLDPSQDKAMVLFENSFYFMKKNINYNEPEFGCMLFTVGKIQRQLGFASKAIASFLESLMIRRYLLGNDHYLVSETLFQLGQVYELVREYECALNVYQETLRIEKVSFGSTNLAVATTLSNIGHICHERGDIPKAIEAFKEALLITINSLGKQHFSIASLFVTIGQIFQESGMIYESVEAFSESKNIAQCILSRTNDDGVLLLLGLVDLYLSHPIAAGSA